MDFSNKNVLVCGIAKSGVSAALLLKKLGANVTIQDIKESLKDEEIEFFQKKYITLYLNKNPDEKFINNFDLLVLSPGISSDLDFVKYAKSKLPVISEIELAYLNCKSKIVSITGTNGKTTTTSLMYKIVRAFTDNVQVVGNIGVAFSEKVLDLDEKGIFISEISSFQLENINKFKPYVSAVLNITPDHLNRHKTFENYIKAKERIFENQDDNDFLVLNYNDEICRKMNKKTKAKVLFFSKNNKNYKDVQAFFYNDYIYINFQKKPEKFINVKEIKLLGLHNVENIMACILISHTLNIPLSIVKEVIKNFAPVEHRNEYVSTINGVDYFNDSKGTNPDASIKAILSMKKPIHLIAGGYDKNSDFSDWIKTFSRRVKNLVVIGECKDYIIDFCKKNNFFNYQIAENLQDAVKISYKNAKKGECVLLSPACASWDMFKNFEERGNLFKKYVLDLRGEKNNA